MSIKSKLYLLISWKKDVQSFTFEICDQNIELRNNIQSLIILLIGCTNKLQYDLICIIISDRNYCQNNAFQLFYIRLNNVLYKLDIESKLLFRFRINEFK